jgi:hypothetical protein
MRAGLFWTGVAAFLLASRLAHFDILWADEDYHLAAAIQMLHGKMLYRDVWYDKPPLAALLALLFGAYPGWPLRIAGTLVALGSCGLAFGLASGIWSRREGFCAAGLLAFFQVFYLAPAIMPFEPDTLMIAPHLAAVWLAWRRRFLWAGAAAALAFLLSPKGMFVLAACALWGEAESLILLCAGFALPCAAVALWLWLAEALPPYFDQVWRWGFLYAASPPGPNPAAIPDWMGFHAALVLGAGWFWWKDRTGAGMRLLAWTGIALVAASISGRFAPRYFDIVLTALAIPSARGIAMLPARRMIWAILAITLAVPAARFGPRYIQLAVESLRGQPHAWADVAMDQESRRAAAWLSSQARQGETLFIWGYRPNIAAYTRMPIASRFWDSQPVTGVPADRHLSDSRPVAADWAQRNRGELARSMPAFVVDGLGAYNPALDIHRFEDLAQWLAGYCEAARIGKITIYRVCSSP